MNPPLPHSFSRSPVEEVFCLCTCGSDTKSLSLTIPPPYPGWPQIREGISDMIAGAGEITGITGCLLRYTDLIPFVEEESLPGTGEIVNLLSGKFECSIGSSPNEIVLVRTNIPDTTGSIWSIHHRPGKPGWTLIFTMNTGRSVRFASADSVLAWFAEARAGIHELFDLIVPEEIVRALR